MRQSVDASIEGTTLSELSLFVEAADDLSESIRLCLVTLSELLMLFVRLAQSRDTGWRRRGCGTRAATMRQTEARSTTSLSMINMTNNAAVESHQWYMKKMRPW